MEAQGIECSIKHQSMFNRLNEEDVPLCHVLKIRGIEKQGGPGSQLYDCHYPL